MVEDFFSRIKELEQNIQTARDRSEASRQELERSDESLRLYMTSIPLFVLGGAIASIDYEHLAFPILEVVAWILFFLSFLSAVLQHAASSAIGHDTFDGILNMWDQTEARQKINLIQNYLDLEVNEEARTILTDYLNKEKIKAEGLKKENDNSSTKIMCKYKNHYKVYSEYGGFTFIISLVIGFILLLISRSSGFW